jgi:hypothetical protein
MAAPDVIIQSGKSDPHLATVISSPMLNPSPKETQESLKNALAKYLAAAAENVSPAIGKLFDPSKHLAYVEPEYIHTMEDIGFPSSRGVSPVAVSEPFPLFTAEAIDIMRSEILSKDVQEKHSYTSDIAAKQLRGYAPK